MLSRAKSLLLNAALAVALLAGAVAVAAETGMIVTERPPEAAPSVLEGPTPKIAVRGTVKGLYPGASQADEGPGPEQARATRSRLVSVRAHVKDASADCTRAEPQRQALQGLEADPPRTAGRRCG